MKKNAHIVVITAVIILAFTSLLISAASSTPDPALVLSAENTVIKLARTVFKFDGNEKKPDVIVTFKPKDGSKIQLEYKKDYTVTYTDNRTPGAAKATVAGKGRYSGKLSVKFAILPQKVTGFKVVGATTSSLKLSWNAVSGAKGYDICIFRVAQKTTKHIFIKADKASYTIKNMPADRDYRIKVRAFVHLNGERKFGAYCEAQKTATKPVVGKTELGGYCTLKSVPTLTWSKVSKAEKYSVLRSSEKNGKYKRIGVTSSLSFADNSASLHKTYFYKVKAIRTLGGKTFYGRESNAKKLQAKKTVFVGDSIMSGLEAYKVYDGTCIYKVGMGPYTFYSSYYFTVNGSPATGVEKVISYNPDRIFIMLGMNEAAYKGNAAMIEYYKYAIEDILDARPNCEIVILPVSPTTAGSAKTVPKRDRINSLNSALKSLAKETGVKYYDYTGAYKDSNGYLLRKYNGGDGCHWNIAGYRLFLDKIDQYIKGK